MQVDFFLLLIVLWFIIKMMYPKSFNVVNFAQRDRTFLRWILSLCAYPPTLLFINSFRIADKQYIWVNFPLIQRLEHL